LCPEKLRPPLVICLDGLFDPSPLIRQLLSEEIHVEYGPDCCMCCDDAKERLRTWRPLVDACDCVQSPEGERCECSFCRVAMALQQKKC
jgi:hypothetical protein